MKIPSLGRLWQLNFVVEVEGFDARPDLGGEGPAQLGDQSQLMLFGVSLEKKKKEIQILLTKLEKHFFGNFVSQQFLFHFVSKKLFFKFCFKTNVFSFYFFLNKMLLVGTQVPLAKFWKRMTFWGYHFWDGGCVELKGGGTCMMGDLVHISAMMQPAPHVSTAGP